MDDLIFAAFLLSSFRDHLSGDVRFENDQCYRKRFAFFLNNAVLRFCFGCGNYLIISSC
jgi:hypothetical protein